MKFPVVIFFLTFVGIDKLTIENGFFFLNSGIVNDMNIQTTLYCHEYIIAVIEIFWQFDPIYIWHIIKSLRYTLLYVESLNVRASSGVTQMKCY